MWKLMFNGEEMTGYSREQVVENLATMLKRPPDAIRREFFTGTPVCVETVATEAEANRRRREFANAGALLIVLPADEQTPGGSRYAGADPANINIEEPTFASVFARLPAIRRRNEAYMILGMLVLAVAVVLVIVLKLAA